jgi:omega-hydroxy-beta-dihydromenaquinone-9 sulfotransferase
MSRRRSPHPLSAMSARKLTWLLAHYGVSAGSVPRAAGLLLSSALTVPIRLLDRATAWIPLRGARFDRPPVFIVGHWRSGTTHLHNLMCRDQQFGFASMFQSMTADFFVKPPAFLRGLMGGIIPNRRPMDDVKVALDEPQEEELALMRTSTVSFNHAYNFPRAARRIFDRCVLFEDAPRAERQWKRAYRDFLRRLAVSQGGRRLCLKNPPNTGRLRQILDLFPDARFIHIYRNPYVVYDSTLHLWKSLLPQWSLQKHDPAELPDIVLEFYRRLMERYFEDSRLIAPGRLTEVRFEQLETRPLEELERVYGELELDGFTAARPAIETYARSLADYRKNRYDYDSETARRVREQWGFTIERWGYEVPGN